MEAKTELGAARSHWADRRGSLGSSTTQGGRWVAAESYRGSLSMDAGARELVPVFSAWDGGAGNWTEMGMRRLILSRSKDEGLVFSVVILALTEAVGLAGLAGNGIILWLLSSRIYRNHFSIYLLDLASADFLFLCCHMVIVIPETLQHDFSFPHYVYDSLLALRFFFYTVGLSLLGALSAEQCAATLWPTCYRRRRPPHTSAIVCALLWALCLLLHFLSYGTCGELSGGNTGTVCSQIGLARVGLLCLLLSTMCVSSLILLIRGECGSQRRGPQKFYLMILFPVLTFLFCGLPFGIYRLSLNWLDIPAYYYCLSVLMACVNSSAKPAIYFCVGSLRQRSFREPLKAVLLRALGDEEELGEGGEMLDTGPVEM
ncbi:mas-related G-protein coupled receptor member E-like [Dromiciops gliroides]|uniref:mas-related G-protein coupled receptor member E-like n=1 Tax=Dromiciops gliroides TaxID=33562 RepID=UPI001CC4DEEE|nr:mas-related G-protein coupled receptor member E-like [Dromiciops gliroides]